MSDYSAKDLQVLEGLEAVRLRPGMYIGTTGVKGLHHILWEIVDNSMDEAANGFADKIDIIINEDNSVSVEDNGRGIPVDINTKYNMTGVEIVFTKLHAGDKFDNKNYKFSGGLHGVGASVTNALSEWLTVEVFKEKKHHMIKFYSPEINKKIHSGILKEPIQVIGKTNKIGTKVTFMPDVRVFKNELLDTQTIKKRIKELAFLNKGVKLSLEDKRVLDEEGKPLYYNYYYQGGIVDFVNYLNKGKETVFKKDIYIKGTRENFELEIAIQYTNAYGENIYSYVNNIPTTEGGTHETGFKSAFTKCFNDYARKKNLLKAKDNNLIGDDFRDGMTCVMAIKMQNVQFEGQTKSKLGNNEAKTLVESIVIEELDKILNDNKYKEVSDGIVKNAINASKVREVEKKAKELQREKNNSVGALIGKFSGCSSKDASLNEIFIVEGDSAGGSAKQGRDKMHQAILPLRGKPINVEKKSYVEAMKNEELKTIIYALGVDVGKNLDLSGLKFHKVIILADADQDGGHICSILLAFFYRYMRDLITEGHVYVGMPPLYKVEKKGVIKYAYNEMQLEEYIKEFKTNYTIQRYKGLGEMNPLQLWETTMSPKTRCLTKVVIDDPAEAEIMMATFLGDNIDARKEYISENANFNKRDEIGDKYL